jgi:rubrerythrin
VKAIFRRGGLLARFLKKERRYGKMVRMVKCSNCGIEVSSDKNWTSCPVCGADWTNVNESSLFNVKDNVKEGEKGEKEGTMTTMEMLKISSLKEGYFKIEELRKKRKEENDAEKKKKLLEQIKEVKRQMEEIRKEKRKKKEEKTEMVKEIETKEVEITKSKKIEKDEERITSLVLRVADQKDEEQISLAVSGMPIKQEYCYYFKVGGKYIYGISKAGAIELAKIAGGILTDPRIPPRVISETEKTVRVGVSFGLVKNGELVLTLWGVGEASKWKKLKDGTVKFDDKCFLVATAKAQRNAILSLLPQQVKDEVIKKWIEQGYGREITIEELEKVEEKENE